MESYLLDYASLQRKPIIFITDDLKEDWWLLDSKQQPIQPRPELIQEMFEEADVLLYMYQGYEFLEQAEHFLKLEENPDIIEEAKEIAQSNKTKAFHELSSYAAYKEAEDAVLKWLEFKYPEEVFIPEYMKRNTPIDTADFVVYKPDGRIIGFEVKAFSRRSPGLSDVASWIGTLSFMRRSANISKYILIIVCSNNTDAEGSTLVIMLPSLREKAHYSGW